jgi:hypothetical protein
MKQETRFSEWKIRTGTKIACSGWHNANFTRWVWVSSAGPDWVIGRNAKFLTIVLENWYKVAVVLLGHLINRRPRNPSLNVSVENFNQIVQRHCPDLATIKKSTWLTEFCICHKLLSLVVLEKRNSELQRARLIKCEWHCQVKQVGRLLPRKKQETKPALCIQNKNHRTNLAPREISPDAN